jgi:hypothetical protein
MSGAPRYARVRAALGRAGWARTADHTATVGMVTGRGTSDAAALADLGSLLEAMAGRANELPSLWWDESGRTLWVAVGNPLTGDHDAVTVDMSGDVPRITSTSNGSGPACRAFSGAVGTVPVHR